MQESIPRCRFCMARCSFLSVTQYRSTLIIVPFGMKFTKSPLRSQKKVAMTECLQSHFEFLHFFGVMRDDATLGRYGTLGSNHQ